MAFFYFRFIAMRMFARNLVASFAFASPGLLFAGDVVLDDFSWSATPSGQYSYHSGTMIGGEADLTISFSGSVGDTTVSGGALRIHSTQPNTDARFVYDGVDGSSNSNYGLNLDVTGGGTNDRFRIDITSLTGTVDIFIWIGEGENDGLTKQRTVSAAGIQDFLLEDFLLVYGSDGVDLAAVKEISVSFYGLTDGESVVVDSLVFTGNLTPPNPVDPNAGAIAVLEKKIKRTKGKLKTAKQKKQKSKVRKLKLLLRKLKVKLRML